MQTGSPAALAHLGGCAADVMEERMKLIRC